MIEKLDLTQGSLYYTLTYFDIECKYPKIMSYFYADKILKDKFDDDDISFFQEPLTYMLYGTLVDHPQNKYISGVKIFDNNFLDAIYDLDGLISAITCIKNRMEISSTLSVGEVLFFISYYDTKFTIPKFDTYIYLGKTIDERVKNRDKTLHLFIEPDNYISKGGMTDNPVIFDADRSVDTISLDRFYNYSQLIDLLTGLKQNMRN